MNAQKQKNGNTISMDRYMNKEGEKNSNPEFNADSSDKMQTEGSGHTQEETQVAVEYAPNLKDESSEERTFTLEERNIQDEKEQERVTTQEEAYSNLEDLQSKVPDSNNTNRTSLKTVPPFLVAIDVGFGFTKILSSCKGKLIFPSIAYPTEPIKSNLFRLRNIDPDKMLVTTEDGMYSVGKLATANNKNVTNRTTVANRIDDNLSRVLFQTGIALGLPDEEGEYEVFLVTGLPNKDYELYTESLVEFLRKPFEVTFNLGRNRTIKKRITVTTIEMLRQPESAYFYASHRINRDYKTDGELVIPKEDVTADLSGVIVIGHVTTCYSLFLQGIMMTDNDSSYGSTLAASEVYQLLREKLAKKLSALGYEYKATDIELDGVVRDKKLYFSGEEHDVSNEVEEAVKEVACKISKDVLDSWKVDSNRLRDLTIAGGIAELFKEPLIELFKERHVKVQESSVMEHAQFSIVYGYYLFGLLAISETFSIEEFDVLFSMLVETIIDEIES